MIQFKKPLLIAAGLAAFAGSSCVLAQPYAYVPNYAGNSVTVLDTATNTVTTTIPVGTSPNGVAVNGNGTIAYVANRGSDTVSVIDTGSNTVVDTVVVGSAPSGIAVSADGLKAYVTNFSSNSVSVLDTTTNLVIATIPVGTRPQGIASSPSGGQVYVANFFSDNVSVIDTSTDSVSNTIAVGDGPVGVEVDPSGTSVYVGNNLDGTVSVISTSGGLVTDTIPVGSGPYGIAISPSGSTAYISNFGNSTLSVISTAAKAVTGTISVPGGPRGVSFNAAGTFAYVGTQSIQRVAVVNTATGAIYASVPAGSPRPLGQTLAQPLFGQGSIGAGHFHTCRVRFDNSADCWGRNSLAQATPPSGEFSRIVGGSAHSCGLRTDGTVTCWGDNSFGQSAAPAGLFAQITSGFRHSCGLRPDGSAECWGDNSQGQSTVPGGTFAQIRGGSSHTCGILTDGTATCWGRNVEGQATVPAGSFIQLALGASFSCALQADSTAVCWGDNTDGRATPLGGTFTQLAAEANYVCGLRNNGDINCWGTNVTGQSSPPAGNFAQIATGRFSACGLTQDGIVQCWGDSDFNQAPRFELSPTILPDGQVGAPYSENIAFSIVNVGTKDPYVPASPVYVVQGTLPSGLSPDGSGNLAGTPDAGGDYTFTVIVEDANGFTAERTYDVSVSVSAPIITPVITGTAGTNGWYVGNVTIGWTVVDPETPVTSTSGCGTVVRSTNTVGTDYTCSATSDGGSSSVTVTIKLDKTNPTLAPVVNNIRPLINDPTVVATPNGADSVSGVASQSCQAISTSVIGLQQVTCTVTDVAGNSYSKPVSYRVIHGFQGFTGDVVNPGLSNSAALNQPINFDYRLVDYFGNGVTGAAAPSFTSATIACPVTISNVTPVSGDAPGLQDLGNGFYRFVWNAPASAGCARLTLNTGDAQTDRRAVFKFE